MVIRSRAVMGGYCCGLFRHVNCEVSSLLNRTFSPHSPIRPIGVFTTGVYRSKRDEKDGLEALTDSIIEIRLYVGNVQNMDALFVELRMFQKYRNDYLDDDLFRSFQLELLKNPEAGDLIEGTGGLRKIRFCDQRRGKGKRSGLRVIYYWWSGFNQFWLFTVYSKDEHTDLSPAQKKLFKQTLDKEINTRSHYET